MAVKDQVKKAQTQLTDNAAAKELKERLDDISDKISAQTDSVQDDLNERFDDVTSRLVDTNRRMAEMVTGRLSSLPGADRIPAPTRFVDSYFDAVERFTAGNRAMATKLVSPWMIGEAKPATKAAGTKKPTVKKASKKAPAATKAPARKTTASKRTAGKSTASTPAAETPTTTTRD